MTASIGNSLGLKHDILHRHQSTVLTRGTALGGIPLPEIFVIILEISLNVQ